MSDKDTKESTSVVVHVQIDTQGPRVMFYQDDDATTIKSLQVEIALTWESDGEEFLVNFSGATIEISPEMGKRLFDKIKGLPENCPKPKEDTKWLSQEELNALAFGTFKLSRTRIKQGKREHMIVKTPNLLNA